MSHSPFRNKGSAKVAGAKRRAAKEKTFLQSLTVCADDPDSVLDDKGKVLPVAAIYNRPGVTFKLNDELVTLETIVESFRVISECLGRVKALLG